MDLLARSRLPKARLRVSAALSLLLAAALTPGAATAAELRGFASLGLNGLILFQPCEGKKLSTRTLRVDDATPEAALAAGIDDVRKIMLESGRPLYVEFRADVAGLVATARQFQRALGTVAACDSAPTDIAAGTRLWASGEDPAWRFVLTSGGAQLERPGQKPVRFPASAFAVLPKPSPSRVIDAWSPRDGGSIRLELTEELCSDGRSESAFGARATLRYGSATYEGCAARF